MNKSSANALASRGRKEAYKMVLFQLALSFTIALVGLAFSTKVSWSLLSGSLIVVFVNFIFATIVFRRAGAQAAKQVQKAFVFGESLKLILTLVLLAIVFTVIPVVPPAVLIGFSLIVLSQWFAPLIVKPSY